MGKWNRSALPRRAAHLAWWLEAGRRCRHPGRAARLAEAAPAARPPLQVAEPEPAGAERHPPEPRNARRASGLAREQRSAAARPATAKRILPHGPENAADHAARAMLPLSRIMRRGQPIGGEAWALAQRMLAAIGLTPEQAYSASLVPLPFARRAPAAAAIARILRTSRASTSASPSRSACCCSAMGRRWPCSASPSPRHAAMFTRSKACAPSPPSTPAHLIKRPLDKSLAWQDLLLLMEDEVLKLRCSCSELGLRQRRRWRSPQRSACAGFRQPEPSRSRRRPPSRHAAVRQQPAPPAVAPVAAASRRIPRDWRGVFDAIDAGNWASAQAGIAALPPSVLTPVAKAELYTAKNSPAVDVASLQALIAASARASRRPTSSRRMALQARRDHAAAGHSRKADRSSSARRRSAIAPGPSRASPPPTSSAPRSIRWSRPTMPAAPKRCSSLRAPRCRPKRAPRRPPALPSSITSSASTWTRAASPTPGGRARPANGRAQAAWVSGPRLVAAGRLRTPPPRAFRQVVPLPDQRELRAGGLLLGGARRNRPPAVRASVEPLLRAAATTGSAESFYGLLARETLGMSTKLGADPLTAYDPPVEQYPNVQRAIELAKIGEPGLAEEMLRHQAQDRRAFRTSRADPARQAPRPSRDPAVARQIWPVGRARRCHRPLSQSALEAGERLARRSRARLRPYRPGILLPALGRQHGRRRRADAGAARSPHSTCRENRGVPYSRATLTDPRYNLEFGQSFIETMRGTSSTAGQLPRVIASYNAGPLPVARWAGDQRQGRSAAVDRIDPLLGDALLRPVRDAEHVGLSGPQPRGHADAEGHGRASLAGVSDRDDASLHHDD